jgi:hypothetical protein
MTAEIFDLVKHRRQIKNERCGIQGDADSHEYYQGIGPNEFSGFFNTETGERAIFDGDDEATVLEFPIKDSDK